jgi:hypothetical protein
MSKADVQTSETESYDRETSPKRRRIEETSASPDPVSSEDESQTEASDDEDNNELNIDRDIKGSNNQSSLHSSADSGLLEEEDELLQRLLDQAEQNSRTHSKGKKVERVTYFPRYLDLIVDSILVPCQNIQ